MRKHQSSVFPRECRELSRAGPQSCSSVHRQDCWNCFPLEKYVHFQLPQMAVSNESALSFLMPDVAFLPSASRHNPANKTHRYFGLKKRKTARKHRGWLEPTRVPSQTLGALHWAVLSAPLEKFFLLLWCFPGPWVASGQTHRDSGVDGLQVTDPTLKWRRQACWLALSSRELQSRCYL